MKALTYAGRQSVRYSPVPDPAIEDPRDAVIKVTLTAVCGSDLHVYHEREKGLDLGTTMGHECVGEIVDLGRDVKGFERGDRVLTPFTTSCGACFNCRRNLSCRCERGLLFGWVEGGKGLQGVQAEYARVPLAETTLVPVPEEVSGEEGLLLGDVFPTGYFCAEMAGAGSGITCAVIGCGPVGLMAILSARDLGAERIFCVDSIPERLELGERFGAIPISFEAEDPVERIRRETEGRGVDAVLEVVGGAAALRQAVDLVRPGGTVASVGVHTEEVFSFSPVEAYDKNLTFRSGRCPARYYVDRLLPLVREGRYPIASVISHRLPLSEGVRAYEIFDRKLDGCTKVVLQP
jgi:threonine dehydrogenase-like Zn-dependent dehydrogenase